MITALSGALAVALLGTVAAIAAGLSLVSMLSTPVGFEGSHYLILGVAIKRPSQYWWPYSASSRSEE